MTEPIKPMVLPEDWPEDSAHENGCYMNRCCVCSREFRGHKRRATCKACTVTEPIKLPPIPDKIVGWYTTHRPDVEAWGRLAVEQATADLHIEAKSLRTGLTFALTREQDAIKQAQRLLAERDELKAELAAAEYALRSRGYRKSCEISACNCGDQWSHGGNAEARLRELSSELHGSPVDMNGKTLLAGLSELVERAEKAEAEVERLRAELDRRTTLNPAKEMLGWTPKEPK